MVDHYTAHETYLDIKLSTISDRLINILARLTDEQSSFDLQTRCKVGTSRSLHVPDLPDNTACDVHSHACIITPLHGLTVFSFLFEFFNTDAIELEGVDF